ncbi:MULTISPECIES: OzmP [Frankia]|uniref:OzmP n=1 Tax=unclassified Frankia TaxID=2632575 RepID=UPI00030F7EB4|nr:MULTISPECIES: OzmP [Frankia]
MCNLCSLDVAVEMFENFTYVSRTYEEFANSGPNERGPYDCLLMYSGGKDSTYMLDKFVNEYHKRVVSYTFEIPFESSHAAANMRLAQERIPATFVTDRSDKIKDMMREVFNRPVPERPGKYLDEKLPCVSCRSFFVIRAILHAWRNNIPYIILCADPQQTLTMESNVRKIVKNFYQIFGRDRTGEFFSGGLEELLFADERELPKIVFPFVALRDEYDPDRIVAELKAKGIYESSPFETHCTLFPLLNYYSFRNWGCMFYKLNASSYVRAVNRNKDYDRSTYSVKFPRSVDVAEVEDRLRAIVFEIAAGEGDPGAHEEALVEVFKQLDAGEDAARYVARSFLDLRTVAADMGIRLD